MSIGKCPPPMDSWKKDIVFPLFETWQKRLPENLDLASVKEVRKQINALHADEVMKQFGLMQVVPSPFNIPFTRRERTTHHVIDYSQKMDKEVQALWDTGSELVLRGAEDTTP